MILEKLIHKGFACIGIRGFPEAANKTVRAIKGIQYSRTLGCFYVAYSPEMPDYLKSLLTPFGPCEMIGFVSTAEVNGVVPMEYSEMLQRRRYSTHTIVNYETQFSRFLSFIYPDTAEDVTEDHVKRYLIFLINEKRASVSLQNIAINAIKFYLEHVRKQERRIYYVERPIKERKLPNILSEEEFIALIGQTGNIKHRCIMFLLYSAGLRLGELLNLRIRDIDISRNVINVRGGKGKKDRVTLLSAVMLTSIREYLRLFQPVEWLFEGPGKKQYSPRSVNRIISSCSERAGIAKNVSAHTLRHSFATHLLERGTDLRYIQALLGHESSRTTELYAHVTTKGIDKIKSPLDQISNQLDLEDKTGI